MNVDKSLLTKGCAIRAAFFRHLLRFKTYSNTTQAKTNGKNNQSFARCTNDGFETLATGMGRSTSIVSKCERYTVS